MPWFRRALPRRGRRGPGARCTVEAEIAGLEALPTNALRIEWRKLYRAEPPTRLSRDLLIRGIAYRLQERAHGGLSRAAQRRLRSPAVQGAAAQPSSPHPTLKAGTKLVREWRGRTHTVTVLEEGFDYDGECYRSLTRIAKRITGSHWSGPVFFGLRSQVVRGATRP